METQIVDLVLGPLGTLVLSLVIIFTGMKKKWVFGWVYEEKAKENKEWKTAALRGTHAAEKAVDLAAKHAERDENG